MGSRSAPCVLDPLTWVRAGENVDSLAREMSQCYAVPLAAARRLLIENNALASGALFPGSLLHVGREPLGALGPRWLQQRRQWEANRCLVTGPAAQLLEADPRAAEGLADLAERADRSGWLTGPRIAQALGGAATAVSTPADVADHLLDEIRQHGEAVYRDAMKTLGPEAFDRSSRGGTERLELFLRSHPRYRALRHSLNELPGLMRRRLGPVQPTTRHARWFRRQFAIAMQEGTGPIHRIATQLGRDALLLRRIGNTTGWVLPMGIALYEASQERSRYRQGRALFGSAVAIGVSYWITNALLNVELYAAAAILIGPTGAFLLTALVLGLAMWAMSDITEMFTELAYDLIAEAPVRQYPTFHGSLR